MFMLVKITLLGQHWNNFLPGVQSGLATRSSSSHFCTTERSQFDEYMEIYNGRH